MEDPHEAALDALCLAALRWEDADLQAVAHTLPAAWLAAAKRRRAALSRLDAGDKGRALRRMAASLSHPLSPAPPLPPRARALLCTEVDRETGLRWAAGAPAPRRGFIASAGLRRWLKRLANRSER